MGIHMSKRKLREGITTGTCAAAAASASVQWQIFGRCPESVAVDTPSGKVCQLNIIPKGYPACSVIKDAGDDPDVTNGCEVIVSVHLFEEEGKIHFIAGEGVGRVTLPGLKLDVGEAAVNPVPRQMIEKEIRQVAGDVRAEVKISIPGGEALAKKTFNPRLGIEGGLSVLGTSGIVRPMSESAIIESLKANLSVAAATEPAYITFVLGKKGEDTVRKWLEDEDRRISDTRFVLISNYIGQMLDEAVELGVKKILVGGFAGKLVKVAADIMNTHSHIADGRRETLCTFAALAGGKHELIEKLYECRTMTEAIWLLDREGMSEIWTAVSEKAAKNCSLRTGGNIETAFLLMDSEGRILGKSSNVEAVIE